MMGSTGVTLELSSADIVIPTWSTRQWWPSWCWT